MKITVSLIQWHFYKTRGPLKVHFHELNVSGFKFFWGFEGVKQDFLK